MLWRVAVVVTVLFALGVLSKTPLTEEEQLLKQKAKEAKKYNKYEAGKTR